MARVLVVYDDDGVRGALGVLLTDEGQEVAKAPYGQMTLDLLRTTPHQRVVLLDYLMPVLDRWDMLEAVATDLRLATRHAYSVPACPHLDGPLEPLRAALGMPLIPKLFDLDELLDAIAQAETQPRAGQPAPASFKRLLCSGASHSAPACLRVRGALCGAIWHLNAPPARARTRGRRRWPRRADAA
jgi:CheY-like chemotaxis protein